ANPNNTFTVDNVDWATYCGGDGQDIPFDCTTDTLHNFFVCGMTTSVVFPSSGSVVAQSNFGGYIDCFISKFDTSLKLAWSTFYGGSSYTKFGHPVSTTYGATD